MVANMSPAEFVSHSLELNLFFLRIMKEHALFLEAGFASKDKAFIDRADRFKNDFNTLLTEAVAMADGQIHPAVLASEELVTPRTVAAERKTEELTGIPIDINLTTTEMELTAGSAAANMEDTIRIFNDRVLTLTSAFADFKTSVLQDVTACRLFTSNFPSMIQHVIHEADHYREHLEQLQAGTLMDPLLGIVEEKVFWDHIMADHGRFIAHYLDPAEMALIKKANRMATAMTKLEERAKELEGTHKYLETKKLVAEEIDAVSSLRDFKRTGEEAILACQVKALISPLLADHVFREASHFLRTLEEAKMPAAGSKSKPKIKSKVKSRRR